MSYRIALTYCFAVVLITVCLSGFVPLAYAQTPFGFQWNHRISAVVHVSVSSDGQLIAAVSSETGAYVFAADGRELWSAKPDSGQGFKSVAISSDDHYLVAGQDDEQPAVGRAGVYLYNAETGNESWSYETKGLVWSVGISSDGKYVVAGSADNHVYFFQTESKKPLWSYEARLAITSVAISSDGRYVAAAGNDGIYMFNRASGRPVWNYSQYGEFYSVSISPDGEYVVGGSLRSILLIRRDGAVLWNTPIGGDPWAVAISNDSQFVVVGSEGPANEIRLLERENATSIWYHSLEQPVESVAISSNDKFVMAGGDDHQAHAFDRETGRYLMNYTTDDNVYSVSLSSDGGLGAAGGGGSVVCFNSELSSQSSFSSASRSSTVSSVQTTTNVLSTKNFVDDIVAFSTVTAAIVGIAAFYLQFVRRPRQKARAKLGILSSWVANVTSYTHVLTDPHRRLEKLILDNRPLDELALAHPQLASLMVDFQGQAKELNHLVETYERVVLSKTNEFQTPARHPTLTLPLPPEEAKQLEESRRWKKWANDQGALIDLKRRRLFQLAEKLKASLDSVLKQKGIVPH